MSKQPRVIVSKQLARPKMIIMRRKIIFISDVIKIASSPIMFVGRIWGLFPMVVEKRGSYLVLKWSPKYFVYSAVLGALLVIMTIHGMINDLEAGSTKSIRMKQHTGKYVTIVDISIVALIVFIGVFGTPFRLVDFFSYLDCINEVDSSVVVSDAKRARKISVVRLCVVLTAITIILGFDLAMWWTIGDRSQGSDFLIGNYIPFYISYYIILLLEMQYWHMVYCIQRRLCLLNGCLKIEGVTTDDIVKSIVNKPFSVFKKGHSTPAHATISVIDAIGRQKTIVDVFFIKNANKLREVTITDYVVKLTRAYLKLCEAADSVNQCCGLIVLIVLTSCLLHLVVTPYFLILEITGRRNPLFATLQTVWLLTHLARLIIIVEACYSCTSEARKTKPLVCKLLCYDFDRKIKDQLELFATELNHRRIEYTACGLVTIDRTLITSIAGAVTTYLVILIQFQKNDK